MLVLVLVLVLVLAACRLAEGCPAGRCQPEACSRRGMPGRCCCTRSSRGRMRAARCPHPVTAPADVALLSAVSMCFALGAGTIEQFKHLAAADAGPLAGLALPPERATFLQTTTIALQAVHDASLKFGDRVAIFGLGTFGLLAVQLARLNGAEWIVAVDPLPARRALAEQFGADFTLDPTVTDVGLEARQKNANGVDVAIEFSGSPAALQQAMRSVRMGGTIVAAGFYAPGELRLGEEFHHNRLTLVASQGGWSNTPREPRWPRPRARALAANLLATERVQTNELLTHRFPFVDAAEAYELIDAQPAEVLRVALHYS